MKFLNLIRKHHEQTAATRIDRWRQLLRRAAFDDDLPPAEAVELAELHELVGGGIDLELMAGNLRRRAELKADADSAVKSAETRRAEQQALAAFDAETQRLVDEHDTLLRQRVADRQAIVDRIGAAGRAEDAARLAADERERIESDAWRFFGRADPAVAAAELKAERERQRTHRHLSHNMMVMPVGQYPVMHIGAYLSGLVGVGCDPTALIFEALPGQQQEELDELIAVATRCYHAAGRVPGYCYLIERADVSRLPRLAPDQPIRFYEDVLAQIGKGAGDPRFDTLRYPGQSVAELAGLREKLTAAYLRHGAPERA